MRILIHGLNYAPELTGIGKYTGEMAEWLAIQGHEVTVVTAPPYYPHWQVQAPYRAKAYRRESLRGVTVYRCPLWVPSKPRGITRIIHLLSWAVSSLPVSLRLVFWKPKVVFTVAPTIFGAMVALLTARLSGARSWVHIQDFELDAALELGILSRGKMARWPMAAERWLLARFDRVSSISESMVQRLRDKGVPEDKTLCFPNWVACDEVHPLPVDSSLRLAWGLDLAARVVLYAGNIGKKQGLGMLVEVARHFRGLHPNMIFLVVGEGVAKPDLERKIVEENLINVVFKPLQPVDRLTALLATANIHLVIQRRGVADLVMPSKLAGILAAGGVALVTAEPETELHRIVNQNQVGIAVEPESASAVIQGLELLLDDDRLCAALRKNARRYAETRLDREAILSLFESQMQELSVITEWGDHR
ncbi:putative colanic acid biosynthesis glycosyl transferase WcaI [Gammaproteobacteria bacterium]